MAATSADDERLKMLFWSPVIDEFRIVSPGADDERLYTPKSPKSPVLNFFQVLKAASDYFANHADGVQTVRRSGLRDR